MDKEFWLEAWAVGRTRFHKQTTNQLLLNYGRVLEKAEVVFVPLCGKTLDMIYLLSQGKKVIGVELSELAVESFFQENDLQFSKEIYKNFQRYSIDNLTIYCGNLFDLSVDELGAVDGLYDRASLVALPKAMRASYTSFIKANCPKLKTMLLGSFEYDQTKAEGPPFSVSEEEIRQAYEDQFSVELLEREITEDKNPRFEDKGIEAFYHTAYALSVRA